MIRISLSGLILVSCSWSTAWAIDAPTNVSASLGSSGTVEIGWDAVADATAYNIYRDDDYIDTVAAPIAEYTDTTAGTSYYVTSVDDSVSPAEFSPASMEAFVNQTAAGCDALPSHSELTVALKASIAPTGGPTNGGFDLHMWATVVDRDGKVCALTRSGDHRGDQWPGSRVISAQKANTANAFSLPGLALSTANLWAATQPGGSLFGLQFSNPVDTAVAYADESHGGGSAEAYGTSSDPMTGALIGGVNVFGGGLALYNSEGALVGAVGVSGDTSCADHNIAWRVRNALDLDYVPGGVGTSDLPDSINYQGDMTNSALEIDFSHPVCSIAGTDNVTAVSAALPAVSTTP